MSETTYCPHCEAPVALCARCHEHGGVVWLDDVVEPVTCPDCEGDFINYAPPTLPPDVREALYVALGLAWGSVRGSEEEAAIAKSQEWLADQD